MTEDLKLPPVPDINNDYGRAVVRHLLTQLREAQNRIETVEAGLDIDESGEALRQVVDIVHAAWGDLTDLDALPADLLGRFDIVPMRDDVYAIVGELEALYLSRDRDHMGCLPISMWSEVRSLLVACCVRIACCIQDVVAAVLVACRGRLGGG